MALTDGMRRNPLSAALLGVAVSLGGCAGTDVQIDAPILEAAGINLSSKKVDDENVPERPGIVIPPSTNKLPPPGTKTAAAQQQNWPQDPDKLKKQKEEEEAAAREKYCREGNWGPDAGYGEFEKNIGQESRCQSKFGQAVSKALGGGPATSE